MRKANPFTSRFGADLAREKVEQLAGLSLRCYLFAHDRGPRLDTGLAARGGLVA